MLRRYSRSPAIIVKGAGQLAHLMHPGVTCTNLAGDIQLCELQQRLRLDCVCKLLEIEWVLGGAQIFCTLNELPGNGVLWV